MTSALLAAGAVNATAISYTGNFTNDDDRFYTTFDVTADSTVDLRSFGYAGGINGAGDSIADGGFDSQLFLFNSAGSLVSSDDDASAIISASSGRSWDALINTFLSAGSYTAVLTQFNSDFISGDLLTGVWSGAGVSNFLDVSGSQRNSAYAFDISGDNVTNVITTQVPEPGLLGLLGLGVIGISLSRKTKS